MNKKALLFSWHSVLVTSLGFFLVTIYLLNPHKVLAECGGDYCEYNCPEAGNPDKCCRCASGTDCCSQNVPTPGQCNPNCVGKECGPDGCGGSCGSCSGGASCSSGQCLGGSGDGGNGAQPTSPPGCTGQMVNVCVVRQGNVPQCQTTFKTGCGGDCGTCLDECQTIADCQGAGAGCYDWATGSSCPLDGCQEVVACYMGIRVEKCTYNCSGRTCQVLSNVSCASDDVSSSPTSPPGGPSPTTPPGGPAPTFPPPSVCNEACLVDNPYNKCIAAGLTCYDPAAPNAGGIKIGRCRRSSNPTSTTCQPPISTPGPTSPPGGSTPTPTPTTAPTATPTPYPFVKIYDADVHAQQGINLPTPLPALGKLLDRLIGSEGIVSSQATSPPSGLSQTDWRSQTDWPMFDTKYIPYELLEQKVLDNNNLAEEPSCQTGAGIKLDNSCLDSAIGDDNTLYDHIESKLKINNLNVDSTRKVVILVKDKDVEINDDITVDESAFFMLAVVNGNITVKHTVRQVQGLYYAQGDGSATGIFSTGSKPGDAKDDPLTLSGIFITAKLDLMRDLGSSGPVNNSNTPAETFFYKPSLLFTAPNFLMARYTIWEEIAP